MQPSGIERFMTKLINIFDYDQAAQTNTPEPFFGYFASGAAEELPNALSSNLIDIVDKLKR